MEYKPFSLIALTLIFALTAAGLPVSDLYAYVVADAGEETAAEPYAAEIVSEPATADALIEGKGDYICYECRLRFETEAEYVEHIKAEHPDKWEAMKSDYEGWFEEYEPETKSGFELNPYLKFALVSGAFAAAWIIIHYWQGTLETTE
jgi:hypothetical protein